MNSAERSIKEALESSLENYATKNVSIDYMQRNVSIFKISEKYCNNYYSIDLNVFIKKKKLSIN